MAEGSATNLLREAKELLTLVRPGNVALVAASVTALARKAAQLGDPRTGRKIENMLSLVVSNSGRPV
jgi:hypothetical protein